MLVTFDLNGGDGEPPVVRNVRHTLGRVPEPLPPTRLGYDFRHWSRTQDGIPFDFANDYVTTATTLYAIWQIAEFTLTLMFDEATLHHERTLDFGSTIDPLSLPAEPTKEGHDFMGWTLSLDDTIPIIFTIPSTMPAENIRLYAVFTRLSFTITFVVQGVEINDVRTFLFGAPTTEPENVYLTGHRFRGWTLSLTHGTIFTIPTYMPAYDLRVYAIFTELFTLTLIVDDETIATHQLEAGDPIDLDEPQRHGYSFLHWSLTPDGDPVDFETMPPYNLTLYAIFQQLPRPGSGIWDNLGILAWVLIGAGIFGLLLMLLLTFFLAFIKRRREEEENTGAKPAEASATV